MGSILAIGILLIKGVFRQKLSAKVHYYIWFVLVLRLLITFSVESPLSLVNIIPQYQQRNIPYIVEQNSSSIQTSSTNNINENFVVKDSNKNSVSIIKGLGFNFKTSALVWLIGASGILLYIITVNILLLLSVKKHSPCERQDIVKILEQCKLRLKVNSKVSVVYDVLLKSPMLYGLIHPKILISPELINKLSQEELKFVFLHELSHIKRRDLIVNAVGMLIQVVYWFNPIIWYSIYKMKQDCEISCDATVLAALSLEENKKYGQAIISMMKMISELHWIPGTVGFASKYNTRRIIMITLFKKASIKWTVMAFIMLFLLAGCSSLISPTDHSSSISPANSTSQNENSIQKPNGTSIALPSSQDTTKISTTENNEPVYTSKQDNGKNSFVKYLSLLGLSKEKLISTLNERPNSVDEAGLEFKEAGIRVWFDQKSNTVVNQVFTQRKDIDLNGVKIGDKIDRFKKVFGNPVSDKNGDMHFKYKEDIFISVNYDTKTEETYAVYFLKENF